jgi:hypothetical protein
VGRSQILEKDSPGLENWPETFYRSCISKGQRKKLQDNISKANNLKRVSSETYVVVLSRFCKGLGERKVNVCTVGKENVKDFMVTFLLNDFMVLIQLLALPLPQPWKLSLSRKLSHD